MTIVQFPGKDDKHPKPEELDPHAGKHLCWVCACGCTTYTLRPGYVIECASCLRLHSGEMGFTGAWQEQLEPPVPEVLKETRQTFVVDFQDNFSSLKRVIDRIHHEDTAFMIHVTNGGSVHTWGKIEGPARRQWFTDRMTVAVQLLCNYDLEESIAKDKESAHQHEVEPELWEDPKDGAD